MRGTYRSVHKRAANEAVWQAIVFRGLPSSSTDAVKLG
jgi:hypothetical protein